MIGIEHLGVYSKNVEVLKDWYINLFGWKQVYTNEEKRIYFVKADDGVMIEFCQSTDDGGIHGEKATGLRHIAISVDDFEDAVKRVRNVGAEIITDAAISAKGVGTMFFKDPDGNVLHLINRTTPL